MSEIPTPTPPSAGDQDRLLALERLLDRGPGRYDQQEVASLSGLPVDVARRFWLALGLPEVAPGERAFTDADVEALSIAAASIERGTIQLDEALQVTRVMAASAARVAETQLEVALDRLRRAESLGSATLPIEGEVLLSTPRLLDHMWRRHLLDGVRRARMRAEPGDLTPELAVGFVDLVGFTVLSQQLDQTELAEVVDRFGALAHDTVAAAGGRVIKMIGDEAMFAIEDVAAGAELALTLSETYADEHRLSDVRVGLAWGPVLTREGDLYGPVVNLASRIVGIARPGAVIVAPEVHEALADVPGYAWRPMRTRSLRGIGRVQLWVLRRAT